MASHHFLGIDPDPGSQRLMAAGKGRPGEDVEPLPAAVVARPRATNAAWSIPTPFRNREVARSGTLITQSRMINRFYGLTSR